jgi:hypothetical protein
MSCPRWQLSCRSLRPRPLPYGDPPMRLLPHATGEKADGLDSIGSIVTPLPSQAAFARPHLQQRANPAVELLEGVLIAVRQGMGDEA